MHIIEQDATPQLYSSFLVQYEGLKGIADTTDTEPNTNQFIFMKINDAPYDTYLTELGEINGTQIMAILNDQSTLHVVTKKDPFDTEVPMDIIPRMPLAFTFDNYYLSNTFQGIMPDSGTAGVLTIGNP